MVTGGNHDRIRRIHQLDRSAPFDLPWPDAPQVLVAAVAFFVALAVGAGAIVATALRMRRSSRPQRQQQAWFVAGVVVTIAAAELPLPQLVDFAGHAAGIIAIGVGIVRYQLFDIELVLSRTVVFALLSIGSLASYFAVSWLLGSRLGTERGGLALAMAAAVTALLLAGLRQRLQAAVERGLYGERRDPLSALTELGERLGGAIDSEAVLPTVVETVRDTLRLPYAAVELAEQDVPVQSSGERPANTASFPLAHAGHEVGVLVVGLRRGETELASADRELLSVFARQVGVAAHGVLVTHDLRRSRERIVLAREEERRRLRRDLHDGVGPALAGIALGLETAGRAARRESSSTVGLIADLQRETTACLGSVRQVAADLRPPTLDQIGLVAALRQQADLFTNRSSGQLDVSVAQLSPMPPLTAALESAAFRIAVEAIANTARHGCAHTCSVSVRVHAGNLCLVVRDDGSGKPAGPPGIGLMSMRERAEELGGRCVVTFVEDDGTEVAAQLPVTHP